MTTAGSVHVPRLQQLATRSAVTRPTSAAVVTDDVVLSYRELEAASNRLARLLVKTGVVPGDRVCICQRKSPDAIVSMLATLKAGATYVPLDVTAPAARVGAVSEAVRPRVVLGDRTAGPLLPALWPEATIGSLDDGLGAASFGPADVLAQQPDAPAVADGPASDVAHILFTSGSTGTPKGVMVTHAAVAAFVEWAVAHLGYRPEDRVSGHAPLFFDLSTLDVYGAFAAGAALHLVPGGPLSPEQIVEFVESAELTQWFSVPSVLGYLAEAEVLADGCMPTLRRVVCCGDVLRPQMLRRWMTHVPHARYMNLYGPTEATIASTHHDVRELPEDGGAIPIGRACGGEEVLVLDDHGNRRSDGELGEICIAGAGLSPGYWEDAARTAAAFVELPALGKRVYRTGDLGRMRDGVLHFAGRRDGQIKTRGFRVEPGDVETALASIEELADCVVVGVSAEGFEGMTVCCAWIPRAPGAVTPTALRRRAAALLPGYMLPSRWLELDAFPQTSNGKHDRRAVARLFAA